MFHTPVITINDFLYLNFKLMTSHINVHVSLSLDQKLVLTEHYKKYSVSWR